MVQIEGSKKTGPKKTGPKRRVEIDGWIKIDESK